MSQIAQRRCLSKWVLPLGLAAPVLLLIATEFGFLPWSEINCTSQDVDINSGRIRHSRYLLFVPIERRVEDSQLTKALLPQDLAKAEAEWHRVLAFSPGVRHSPHYVFHSATYQIRELGDAWQFAEFTPTARRASAQRVLQLWQQSGSDHGARDFIRAVVDLSLAVAGEHGNRRIDDGDLPKQ